jgi:hypothetical protein
MRLLALIATVLCAGCSLFSDPNLPHRKAILADYVRYQTDAAYRRKVDDNWRRNNDGLIKDGFKPEPHPFSPEILRHFRIEAVRGVTPDGR